MVMLTRLFIPVLKTHKNSYILNVGSMAGFSPIPYKCMYSASKAWTNPTTNVRINSHGKVGRITEQSVELVAKIGIDGMFKHKNVIIPGEINHLLRILQKIIPISIQEKILAREFVKEVKATSTN